MEKKVIKKAVAPLYIATIKVLGKVYTATGSTVNDSITALKVGVARGVSVLTITHGDVSKERIIGVAQTNNLFNTRGMVNTIHLKQVSSLFDGV